MATINRFEDLEVWQRAQAVCSQIYAISNNSGLQTDYALLNQIDRSSGSIMDNIAEGFEREGNREFINFLSYAKGSAGETRSQLFRVLERKYCTQEEFDSLRTECEILSSKLSNFMSYLRQSEFKGNKFKNTTSNEAHRASIKRAASNPIKP